MSDQLSGRMGVRQRESIMVRAGCRFDQVRACECSQLTTCMQATKADDSRRRRRTDWEETTYRTGRIVRTNTPKRASVCRGPRGGPAKLAREQGYRTHAAESTMQSCKKSCAAINAVLSD